MANLLPLDLEEEMQGSGAGFPNGDAEIRVRPDGLIDSRLLPRKKPVMILA